MRVLLNKLNIFPASTGQKPVQRGKPSPAFGARLTGKGLTRLDTFKKTVLPEFPKNGNGKPLLKVAFHIIEALAKNEPHEFCKLQPPLKTRQDSRYVEILLGQVIPHPNLPKKETIKLIGKTHDIFTQREVKTLKKIVENNLEM